MLQQTTVAAVIPFYERWMETFPTVEALASADIEDVLRNWAGLGYYARARNLHKSANQIVADYGGQLPADIEELRKLPGIGRYTAGAIASIAFNSREPLVDANVARVLSRVFGFTEDLKSSRSAEDRLWALAGDLVPEGDASNFNQAMMELGALVCSAAAPRCGHCPVQEICFAYATGDPTAYPVNSTAKRWLEIDDVAVAVADASGRLLVVRRPLDAPLWGGLWELPRVTRQADESILEAAARAAAIVGVEAPSFSQFGAVKHVVANRKVTLQGFRADSASIKQNLPSPGHHPADGVSVSGNAIRVGKKKPKYESTLPSDAVTKWIDAGQPGELPMATPQVRLLALWNEDLGQGRLDL